MNRIKSVIAFCVAVGALPGLTGCVGTDAVDEGGDPGGDGRIEVTPGPMALIAGSSFTYSAAYFDDNEMEVEVAFTWSSTDPGVADVSGGRVTAVSTGQADIRAESSGVTSDPVTVTVVQDASAVAYVIVSPPTASTSAQGQVQFSADVTNIGGGAVESAVSWQVSDTQVASIDGDGLAIGVAVGTTDVVATADGVASVPAILTIEGESKSGVFQGNPGTSYTASGTAVLRQRPGGGLLLEFNDDFSIDDGPGLEVFLSNSPGVTAESFNLGGLQSISGSQSYQIGGSVTLDTYTHVVIHCVPFNVTFAAAAIN